MSVCELIRKTRAARCGLSKLTSPALLDVAREFGLFDGDLCYKEVDREDALRLITTILHRDLAYNSELLPLAEANQIAQQFLAHFGSETRYYTNGTWHLPDTLRADGIIVGASWDPVTQATFDTGILAIGTECSGCLWVEDED